VAPSALFAKGADVVDVRGEKVGTALHLDALHQYLLVEHGWLVPVLIHVPLYAITRSDTRRIQLVVSKDDVLNGRWPSPPAMAPPPPTPPAEAVTTASNQSEDEVHIPIVEEHLVVGTRREQVGVVRVRKTVVEEPQTITVTLRREVVTVEFVPTTGAVDPSVVADAFTAEDVIIPVMAERAVVTKEAYVVEEVHVRKQDVAEPQSVSETVRKMHVSVDGPGTTEHHPGGTTDVGRSDGQAA
jgi:uncharacterized protein (TIGR02271 family)